MNLNYAIFRSEPIFTINDLAQIGAHNKRDKKSYRSNPDIDINKSKDNIYLVPLNAKYVSGFYNLTKEYKKEHDARMLTMRADKKKSFKDMLDISKSVVADELLMSASHDFFKDMTRDEIINWANTCMEFVYNDLGYAKEQVLHSVLHLDEKTPHIHCVVVPLIKKFDKRTKTERFTISKKQYLKDNEHLSLLQDKYHKRLTDAGYCLERGIKGSDTKHIKIKDYKKILKKVSSNMNVRINKLDDVLNTYHNKLKTIKNVPFDKKHIIVDKDILDVMNNLVSESNKVKEIQPKLYAVFDEINDYSKSYNTLEKENQKYKKEVDNLKKRNNELESKIINLKLKIEYLLNQLKEFFRDILHIGNDKSKDKVEYKVKSYYDNDTMTDDDIIDIASNTDKEHVLFDYADIPSYMRNDEIDDEFVK